MAEADLHVCATTSDGKLFHTIRRGDGSWLGFGDVEGQTGDIGFVRDVAVTGTGFAGDLHVCARTSDGKLFHTMRRADGSWLGFRDVEDQTGDIGSVSGVAVTGFAGNLHVCATTSSGQLFHTIRRDDDGSWLAFRDVEGPAGDIGSVSGVAVTAVAGDFDMCATTSKGKLFHTMRRGDGSWLGFGDVEGQTGDIGTVTGVGLSRTKGGDLHVCATTISKLFHTIRRADGSWLGFRDVQGQAGDIGTVLRVAVTRVGVFDLHVCARTSDGKLFHTIRRADGSWRGFDDVEGQAGDIGFFVDGIGATSFL